ncbi:hypothetical protein [Aneurinibacillus tyrosinisolvens]|uniref:hypothetical protein n=1 Tax=Aneurinibacillus tyrosinisolvens TaxID=1443435 RepID=UPI00069BF219|nr:hypothetical protein [Aneurinibacillus tyrosinisolvens]
MLSIEKQILYILTRIARLEVQELVKIYEGRGYSPQYIRNTLSQLKREDMLSHLPALSIPSRSKGDHLFSRLTKSQANIKRHGIKRGISRW